MRIIPIAMMLLVLAGCDKPQPPRPQVSAPSQTPSQEVRDFLQRRTDCRHWAGEEGYDAARRAEINAAYAKLRCAALEADAAALKARYSADKAVQQALRRAPD
jgi:hypothetical protein